ncbi:MAG: transporter substrate-binding domain-containing protein [Pseudomonas sp.]|uniref:substrate-binding periplasmic protein n=1 Tax=Pseudomonas sp. TaxID=306 RepID=UPI003391E686
MPFLCLRPWLFCLGYGLFSLFSLSAGAADWRVVGSQFPGIFERDARGDFQGLAPLVLRTVAHELGHQVHFELYPWARAQRMVEWGLADILIGPYRNPVREAQFVFSEQPFYEDRIVLYARVGHAARWAGRYEQLRGQRVAVVRGWAYGARFEQERPLLQLITVETVENGLKMLHLGRVDMLLSNERNTRPVLEALELSTALEQLQPVLDRQQGYFAFAKGAKTEQLRSEFNRVFNRMVVDGSLARLAKPLAVTLP